MEINKEFLNIVQSHLGYSEDQMTVLQDNPKTMEIVAKLPDLMNTSFHFKVLNAHGCAAQHKSGDSIQFDGFGCINQQPGQKVCAFAISAMSQLIWTAQEFIYAGVDPNTMKLNRVGCIDVGVKCGGLGNVTFEFEAKKNG